MVVTYQFKLFLTGDKKHNGILMSPLLLVVETVSNYWLNTKQIREHLYSTYAKFSEKLMFLATWYARVRVRTKG